jgi:hypothetical protein
METLRSARNLKRKHTENTSNLQPSGKLLGPRTKDMCWFSQANKFRKPAIFEAVLNLTVATS